jgi:nitroimidazol reductase NimA-like FMN-containing flavoprotein (pyridoxamine 5'-phosphate oxidase superfamily)
MSDVATRARPIVDRPGIPAEYGVSKSKEGLLDWEHVEKRLAEATAYWVATSGPGGVPRVRPVDGLYLDGVLYVGGSPETRWAKDLTANPNVSIHLDGTTDVVIVQGRAEQMLDAGPELAERLAAESNRKYPQYGVTAADYEGRGPFAVRPRKVIAWTDFATNPTRFRFPE